MKIIISHDIDHITAWEHKRDLIIPKFIIRSSLELITGNISLQEYFSRYEEFMKNKWHNLEEIIKFDKENNILSTFFIGVSNSLGMSYSLENANIWTKTIIENGFDVGVHGTDFNELKGIKKDYELFRSISGLSKFGIRMHYLKHNKKTFKLLENAGYLFDSTICKKNDCYKIGNLWEFPLHIMDGYLIYNGRRWQNQSLKNIKENTIRVIDEVYNTRLKYLTILFHDRYFSDSFKTWKEWYIWLVRYLNDNHFTFINYKDAIIEMEANQYQE